MKLFALSVLVSWVAALPAPAEHAEVLGARQCSLTPTNPSTYWYESITHNGISPFIPDGANWPVHRNTDDSTAIQNAINKGNSFADRTTDSVGTTGQPAVVYLPQGTYLLSKPIQLFVGTVIMGDPINPPTLLVAPGFSGNTVVYGKDPHHDSTINFYIGIKNVIIDSTGFDKDTTLNLLDWSVSQAVQLSNVRFQMPYDSTGHTGIYMPEGGSPLFINDCYFHGGVVGILADTQQYHFKGITFDGCSTAIKVNNVFDFVVQGATFSLCGIGIDVTNNNVGTLSLIDATASNVGAVVATGASSTGQGSVVLENVVVTDVTSTVTAGGAIVKTGSITGQAWVWGNAYTPGGPSSGAHQTGTSYSVSRPGVLVDSSGKFHTVPQPTYKEYDVSQVVNVKSVAGLPVLGDGSTDDTENLQTIINSNAGCKILFFPHGTYIITDTLLFPPGSRVFGEAWSTISGKGSAFSDAGSPKAVVKIGNSGDVGVAQINDLLFTVAEVLPGAKLVEVNMAGSQPGDVGIWNSHTRVGGAAGSSVQTNCGDFSPASCKAAFILMHLTASSSAYIENSWLWTADHDLDGGHGQTISVGRGLLVEATKGTWLLGMGIEHNTLYQTNFDQASNVFFGFQQSETPYWQGNGSPSLAPDPWSPLPWASDPDYSWCNGGDAQCRMALYLRISGSSNLNLYGGGFWTFFNGGNGCSGECQTNAVLVQNTSKLFYFGISTHLVSNLVRNNGDTLVTAFNNPGGWNPGATVAAFLTDSQ
ncbi:family 55 glycoside hydrolase [Thozetella sp. PMI_491]|nr:family 55 glycoside hydrolase [Thozetella sp. PMI_491]